jgi:hypothetical protein
MSILREVDVRLFVYVDEWARQGFQHALGIGADPVPEEVFRERFRLWCHTVVCEELAGLRRSVLEQRFAPAPTDHPTGGYHPVWSPKDAEVWWNASDEDTRVEFLERIGATGPHPRGRYLADPFFPPSEAGSREIPNEGTTPPEAPANG